MSGTRSHILTDRVLKARCEDDAIVTQQLFIVDGVQQAFKVMNTRQARQLAYLLCEVADRLERDQ